MARKKGPQESKERPKQPKITGKHACEGAATIEQRRIFNAIRSKSTTFGADATGRLETIVGLAQGKIDPKSIRRTVDPVRLAEVTKAARESRSPRNAKDIIAKRLREEEAERLREEGENRQHKGGLNRGA